MKKLNFLIFAVLISSILSAQSSYISGEINTSEGNPAEYATVIALSETDSAMVKAGYTELDGRFKVGPVESGNYFIKVTYVGYEEYSSSIISLKEGQTLELSKINLTTNSLELDEVVVKAKKPLVEIRPDKTVFNVEGSINATGNTALELLRKSPGVVVDNNDNVILQGKSGVQIYINNKPSYLSGDDLTNLLNSMQSTEIEAIEIITNPSSKYDAEGNAGIINIRIKRNKNFGTNANINLGYAVGIFSKYNGSINVNNRNEKSSIYVNYGHNQGVNFSQNNFFRRQNGFVLDQKGRQFFEDVNHNYRVGADFYLNKKSTIGFMSNGYFNEQTFRSNIFTTIENAGTSNIDRILRAGNNSDGTRSNQNYNVNYRFDNKEGSVLSLDLDYGLFKNDAVGFQPNTYLNADESSILDVRNFRNETPTDIDIYTAKVDYETNVGEGKLSAGAKVSYVNTDNTFNFYNLDENGSEAIDIDRSNAFSYLENVTAGYINYQFQLDKWSFQAGLRAENTHSEGILTAMKPTNNDEVIRDYFNLFPSGGASFNLNEKNAFSLTFSRRIDRPKYQNLNPFEFKLDELTFERGNAFLNPQYTNNIQLSHTFNYRLNTTLSYSKTTDLMAQITDQDPSNELAGFISQLNVAEQDIISLTVSYPFSIAEWWNVFTNINAYHTQNQADYGNGKILDLQANVLSLYTQNTITLPKEFTFELSAFYNSPAIWEGSFESQSIWSIEAGIQKKLWDGRANIKLSVSDIFQSQRWAGVSTFGGFYIEASGWWESRRLKLNFSYLLGNNQVKTKKRKGGLDDESNRIK